MQHLLLDLFENSRESIVLALEVRVEGAVGEAGLLGDVGHARIDEAVALEDHARGVDQRTPISGCVGAQRASSGARRQG
jgi:hypothetical protein